MSRNAIRAPHTPYRSPWPNSAHRLSILNDRRIETYLLRGFYGRDAQEKAQQRANAKTAKRKAKRSRVGDENSVAVSRIQLDFDGLY
jgi:hypothetical protein